MSYAGPVLAGRFRSMTSAPPRRRRVVLFGGQSPEHDVSCVSARHVLAAVDQTRYEVEAIAITREGRWLSAEGAVAALGSAAAAGGVDSEGAVEATGAEDAGADVAAGADPMDSMCCRTSSFSKRPPGPEWATFSAFSPCSSSNR